MKGGVKKNNNIQLAAISWPIDLSDHTTLKVHLHEILDFRFLS
jgi:hypothetical protein